MFFTNINTILTLLNVQERKQENRVDHLFSIFLTYYLRIPVSQCDTGHVIGFHQSILLFTSFTASTLVEEILNETGSVGTVYCVQYSSVVLNEP